MSAEMWVPGRSQPWEDVKGEQTEGASKQNPKGKELGV